MRFSFKVGDVERSRIEFHRDPMLGGVTITANSRPVGGRSAALPSTHFNLERVKRYEFAVGTNEPHQIVIEHEAPRPLAGFRRHWYRVFVDGQLTAEHYGY